MLPVMDIFNILVKRRMAAFLCIYDLPIKMLYDVSKLMTRNSSKSSISQNKVLIAIFLNGLFFLWSNPWMTVLVCLR